MKQILEETINADSFVNELGNQALRNLLGETDNGKWIISAGYKFVWTKGTKTYALKILKAKE